MMDGFHQHPASAASGIVDRLSFLWVEDVHHQLHNGTRCIELARFLIRNIGELLDEVFVGLTENVCLRGFVTEIYAGDVQ